MNRGFKFYFKEGLKALKGFLTKKTGILSYYFYFYVSYMARMIPFCAPLADLANVKAVRMIRDEHQISVTRAFSSSNNPKNYWTLLVSNILKDCIVFAIYALIFAVGVLLALAGTGISFLLDFDMWFILPIVAALPAIGFGAYVTFILPLRQVPNSYIMDFNNNLGATEVVRASFSALKERGKATLFASYIVQGIICNIFAFVAVAVIGISLFAFYKSEYVLNILVFEVIALIIAMVLFTPMVDIIFAVFRLSLYEDLCNAHVTGPVQVYGVNLRRVNMPNKEVTVNEMLEDLFDAEIVSQDSVTGKPITNASNRVQAFNRVSSVKPADKQEKPAASEKPVTPVKSAVKQEKPVVSAKPVETAKPVEQVIKTAKPVEQVIETEKPVEQIIETEKPVEEVVTIKAEPEVKEEIYREPVVEEAIKEEESSLVEELIEFDEELIELSDDSNNTEVASEQVVEEDTLTPVVEEVVSEPVIEEVKPTPVIEKAESVKTVKSTATRVVKPQPVKNDFGFGTLSPSDDIFGFGMNTPKPSQPKTAAKPVIVKTVKKN